MIAKVRSLRSHAARRCPRAATPALAGNIGWGGRQGCRRCRGRGYLFHGPCRGRRRSGGRRLLPGVQSGNGAQELAAMAERGDADLLKVLIGQVSEDSEINVVLGKALGVLGRAD